MRQAQELYRESNGRQQVLPLDSIYKKALPEWDKSVQFSYNLIFITPIGSVIRSSLSFFVQWGIV